MGETWPEPVEGSLSPQPTVRMVRREDRAESQKSPRFAGFFVITSKTKNFASNHETNDKSPDATSIGAFSFTLTETIPKQNSILSLFTFEAKKSGCLSVPHYS